MEEALLKIVSVNKTFGKRQVLKNISFSLEKGEFVSLVGVSGSGKSTLLNILAGLEKPDSGSIFLEKENITNQKGKVSYMFQKDLEKRLCLCLNSSVLTALKINILPNFRAV